MTKAEVAYELVRERVLRGDLTPGAVIPQASLAHELGISTTPLREARAQAGLSDRPVVLQTPSLCTDTVSMYEVERRRKS